MNKLPKKELSQKDFEECARIMGEPQLGGFDIIHPNGRLTENSHLNDCRKLEGGGYTKGSARCSKCSALSCYCTP